MSTTMGAATAGGGTPPRPGRARQGEVTQLRVLHSEWIKLRSLRSTFATLIVAVVALVGLGALFSGFVAGHWDHMTAREQAAFRPGMTSLRGYFLAQLAVGVLGVLVVSGEYATGMIRATFAAVPGRLPVLWAKAGLFAAVTWLLMTAGSLMAFLLGQALLSGRHLGASLGDPGEIRQVMGVGLYLTVVGLLGVALGALLRNTAGGIAAVFGLLLVVPVLAQALPASWGDHVDQWLPSTAGQSVMALHREAHTLAPWTGFAVFCGYAAVALAGAAVLLRRRDA